MVLVLNIMEYYVYLSSLYMLGPRSTLKLSNITFVLSDDTWSQGEHSVPRMATPFCINFADHQIRYQVTREMGYHFSDSVMIAHMHVDNHFSLP